MQSPKLVVKPKQLTASNFALFGQVIENALANDVNSIPTNSLLLSQSFIVANQGTALKASNVSRWVDTYSESESHRKGQPTISMFSCFPRPLKQLVGQDAPVFPVLILERHPYTSQTFVPMGLAFDDTSTRYLVIVAPTLPPRQAFPDTGPPDLCNLQAFVAHGRQAVTYEAGTWHAPMVVIGEKRLDFVVVQSMNGVPNDECQEVVIQGEGLAVAVNFANKSVQRHSKL